MSNQLNTVVKTGKTVEEAVQAGLQALHAEPDDVKIEILSEAKSGFLGIFGAKDAVVRLSLKDSSYKKLLEKDQKEWDDQKNKTTQFKEKEKPIEKIPSAKEMVESHVSQSHEEKDEKEEKVEAQSSKESKAKAQPQKTEKKSEKSASKPEKPEKAEKKEPVKKESSVNQEDKTSKAKKEKKSEEAKKAKKLEKSEKPKKTEKAQEPKEQKEEVKEEVKEEKTTPSKEEQGSYRIEDLLKEELSKENEEKASLKEESSKDTDEEKPKEKSALEASIGETLEVLENKELSVDEKDEDSSDQKEKEGKFLEDSEVLSYGEELLEKTLELMHIDAEVEGKEKDSNLNYEIVNISNSDTGIVIGRHGETLNALQNFLSIALNRATVDHYRVFIDVGGYRIRRKAKVEKMARRNAERVQKSHRKMKLEAMNAYERRIVHTALQDMENIYTVSEGRDPNRRVVICYKSPKNDKDQK